MLGARNDLTSRQVDEKSAAADVVGQESGNSGRQVKRYIRFAKLSPELHQMVKDMDLSNVSLKKQL